ncbi:MAG: dienelactone hydrolase family protein [Chloroflexota bacterium]
MSTRKGNNISVENGELPFDAYFVESENSNKGLIIIQEWWGLVDHIRDVADRFNLRGFNTIAPDLYSGKQTDEPSVAQKYMMELNVESAMKNLRSSIEILNEKGIDRIASLGFCMGGGISLYAASINIVDSAVSYYGVLPNATVEYEKIKCPIQGHYAEHDGATESVKDIENILNANGVYNNFNIYKGTSHAFFNNEREEVYDKTSADLSFERTIEFLESHI